MGLAIACSLFQHAFAADDTVVEVVAAQTALVDGFAVLTGDTTWAATETIILRDTVVVPNGITLTIEPGTTIYSTRVDGGTEIDENGVEIELDDEVGALLVARGGMINAAGTPEAPIVFTAIEELEVECGTDLNEDGLVGPQPTVTSSGLWGGIIVLGSANITLNDGNGIDLNNGQIEGFAPTGVSNDGDALTDVLEYGFDASFPRDDADNSGVLQYVRIQHGGFAFGEGNEINGLTLGGVGSGTTIDHIEIVANSDDGIEFFGGTVNTSNIAVVFCEDDSFDLDNGMTGVHQFWFALQNPNGDRLGEWDGLNGSLSNVSGGSAPQIFNATFVGPGLTAGDDDSALFIDDAFSGTLSNSVLTEKELNVADFSDDGLRGNFGFTNNTVGVFGNFDGVQGSSVLSANAPNNFYVDSGLGFAIAGNSEPGTPVELTFLERTSEGFLVNIDPRPVVGSSADIDSLAPVPAGLETVSYRGAFEPNGPNWLEGWSFLSANGFIPNGVVADVFQMVSSEVVGSNFVVTFNAEPTTTYNVMSDTDLQGFDTSEGTVTTDANGAGIVTIPLRGTSLFIRLEEQ